MPRAIVVRITGRAVGLLLATAAILAMAHTLAGLLGLLLLAVLLAVGIRPLVDRLERKRVPRWLSILAIYAVLLGVAGLAFALLVPVVAAETAQLARQLPQALAWLSDEVSRRLAAAFPQLGGTLAHGGLLARLGEAAAAMAGGAGGWLVELGRRLAEMLVKGFLVLVAGFFFVSDPHFLERVVTRFVPPRARPRVLALARETGERLGHWVRAQLLVGLFFGAAIGVGLALLGVPYAVSLGVAGAVLELVPYVGQVIVTLVAVLLVLPVSLGKAIAVLALEVVVASVQSHVVYPRLVGRAVGLHPLAVLAALFVGMEWRGVPGALLAVPVALVLKVLLDHFYRPGKPATPAAPADGSSPAA
jgi:predicted PurR-regulated permease PerM